MCHHFETPCADSVDNLATLSGVSDLELLLQEYRGLLIGRLDDAGNERVIRRRGRRMEQGQEIYRLEKKRIQ